MSIRIAASTAMAFALALAAMPAGAQPAASDWPSRPVTLVVPLSAGGGGDVLARILAPYVGEALGQPVVVENITGAGGMIGTARVARADPDGYQMVLGTLGTHASSQAMNRNPLYDSVADFEPVILAYTLPLVLTARKDFPADDLKGFIAYAKANQGKLQYGSSGVAGTGHLACEVFNTTIGVKVTHVPYRGASTAMQDLMAGRVDYFCPVASLAVPTIKSGDIKAIGIMTMDRSPGLPDLPSLHEQGLTDFETAAWNAIFLPKGTPKAIVEKLRLAVVAALKEPLLVKRFNQLGVTISPPERQSSEFLKKHVAAEVVKWKAAVKAAGIEPK